MRSGDNSASLAADYLRRGGSYIEALKLLLADMKTEQDAEKAVLLCDAMNELRVISGHEPVSKWTYHSARSWRFWLDRVKAAARDDAASARSSSDNPAPGK